MAGFDGLNGTFRQRLEALIGAAPGGITVGSGFRTRAQQEALFRKLGKWSPGNPGAAKPGHSKHEKGLAADLKFATSAARQWAHANAARFGLRFPMGNEPWHIEPVGLQEGDFDPDSFSEGGDQQTLQGYMSRIFSIAVGQPVESGAGGFFGDLFRQPSEKEAAKLGASFGGDTQQFARSQLGRFGWGEDQFGALVTLWSKESGWNPNAQNPTSTAFGIAQFLDSTWDDVGATKTSDPQAQIKAGLKYIAQRYGSPQAALAFHRREGWY